MSMEGGKVRKPTPLSRIMGTPSRGPTGGADHVCRRSRPLPQVPDDADAGHVLPSNDAITSLAVIMPSLQTPSWSLHWKK
jgi:hypothetical protein